MDPAAGMQRKLSFWLPCCSQLLSQRQHRQQGCGAALGFWPAPAYWALGRRWPTVKSFLELLLGELTYSSPWALTPRRAVVSLLSAFVHLLASGLQLHHVLCSCCGQLYQFIYFALLITFYVVMRKAMDAGGGIAPKAIFPICKTCSLSKAQFLHQICHRGVQYPVLSVCNRMA